VSRPMHRAAPAVAILAIVAGGALWSGCGSSNSVNDSINSAKTQANEAIDKAQKKGNEAIDNAQKQLNEAKIPQKAKEAANEASKKLQEAQGKVNEASKQAREDLESSGSD
jgi:uncharacterized protein HemX